MKKILISFFFLILSITKGQKTENQKIYSVLINQFDNAKRIIIEDSTSIGYSKLSDFDFEQLKKEYKEFENEFENRDLENETLIDFKYQNTNYRKILKEEFSPNQILNLITFDEKEKIFKNNRKGWEKFYRKFPKSQGILTFSNIGFNKDENQALVYFGNQSHYLAGIGYLAYFIKVQDIWKLAGLSELWIS